MYIQTMQEKQSKVVVDDSKQPLLKGDLRAEMRGLKSEIAK